MKVKLRKYEHLYFEIVSSFINFLFKKDRWILECKTFSSSLKSNKFLILQTIEMIEKEQREAERRPITKITHKGEIEIESQEPVKAPEPAEVRDTSNYSLLLYIIYIKEGDVPYVVFFSSF